MSESCAGDGPVSPAEKSATTLRQGTVRTAFIKLASPVSVPVGAGQNRLAYAVNLAQSQLTNLASAESRIRDGDIASEVANLSRAQVLQQASTAAPAQANSAPQAVLALLRG